MAYSLHDTIVAIASPPGPAVQAVVRLSGPAVRECVARLFTADTPFDPARRAVTAGNVRLDGLHSPLPAELYLWPDAHSYTGQPVAELHTLGSLPLLDAVLRAACDAGARLAEPGEFTLRAFLAGRIDLTQAEAVLGVIEARSDEQLNVALGQLAGGLSRPLHEVREELLTLLSHLEAGFDFPDEDVAFITPEELVAELAEVRATLAGLAAQLQARHRAEGPARVALIGPPNAGKSSLFNALAGVSGAIVSHHAGTTRDYLTAEMDISGVRFELIDTAGVVPENTAASDAHLPERAAEEVARREGRRADVRVWCVDVASGQRAEGGVELVVFTKVDLAEPPDDRDALPVSSLTGQGLDSLRARLRDAVVQAQAPPDRAVASTAARCGQSLADALAAVGRAATVVSLSEGEELAAAEIRAALEAVGRVAGTVHTDDVLQRVFSRFCIGK